MIFTCQDLNLLICEHLLSYQILIFSQTTKYIYTDISVLITKIYNKKLLIEKYFNKDIINYLGGIPYMLDFGIFPFKNYKDIQINQCSKILLGLNKTMPFIVLKLAEHNNINDVVIGILYKRDKYDIWSYLNINTNTEFSVRFLDCFGSFMNQGISNSKSMKNNIQKLIINNYKNNVLITDFELFNSKTCQKFSKKIILLK